MANKNETNEIYIHTHTSPNSSLSSRQHHTHAIQSRKQSDIYFSVAGRQAKAA